jgi:DNA-binding transcriptional regulator YiaG
MNKQKEIRRMREKAQSGMKVGITDAQDYCASMLHVNRRTWQKWEAGERVIHDAFFELAKIKLK